VKSWYDGHKERTSRPRSAAPANLVGAEKLGKDKAKAGRGNC
jgi:hypothetical protein